MKDKDEFLDIKESAELTKVKKEHLYNKVCKGELQRYGTRRKLLLSKRELMEKMVLPKKSA